jgi:RNA polymerase sigma-70 factor (ECF subfamily)
LGSGNKDDKELINRVKKDDKLAFAVLFTRYYADLVNFSVLMIRDMDAAEEIVQDLFLKLWENRNEFDDIQSLRSYLLKSVQNRSIDWLRHKRLKNQYAALLLEHPVLLQNDTENYLLYSELESELQTALSRIPEECAQVFIKSRFEAMKHEQIARLLGISVRTVENRISKTVQLLRKQLKDFIALF